ncbi:MAG: TetR/AcrR family transcriptional regulator [Luteolibacter sp.]
MKTPGTKDRILDTAEELIWTRSFHSVGLNEILKTVNVPKGSFYHYFKSKEHFGVELLTRYIEKDTEDKDTFLSSKTEPDPVRRIFNMLESSIQRFKSDGKCPCLVLKLASEVIDLSEPIRITLEEGLTAWLETLASVLDEAKAIGSLSESLDSEKTAAFIRDLWAGSVQRTGIMKSSAPMVDSLSFLRQYFASLSVAEEIHQEEFSATSLPTNLL